MKKEKKIFNAYHNLRRKYGTVDLRDNIIEKLESDVSYRTTARVTSYYLVGPTPDSPPVPDPLGRESNEIASDVERAFRCAPKNLRFDHKVYYEERTKGQESDCPELVRIDEFSAGKFSSGTALRLVMLLDGLVGVDPFIYHKFVACSSIILKKKKPPKGSLIDKLAKATATYTEGQIAKIAAKQIASGVAVDEIVASLTAIIGDSERAKRIVQTEYDYYEQNWGVRKLAEIAGLTTKQKEVPSKDDLSEHKDENDDALDIIFTPDPDSDDL